MNDKPVPKLEIEVVRFLRKTTAAARGQVDMTERSLGAADAIADRFNERFHAGLSASRRGGRADKRLKGVLAATNRIRDREPCLDRRCAWGRLPTEDYAWSLDGYEVYRDEERVYQKECTEKIDKRQEHFHEDLRSIKKSTWQKKYWGRADN